MRLPIAEGIELFEKRVRRDIPTLRGWSPELCRAVASRYSDAPPPRNASAVQIGAWVAGLGAKLRKDPAQPWSLVLDSGLNATKYPQRWFGLARDLVAEAGFDLDRFLWNYGLAGEPNKVWTNDEQGRQRFVKAVEGAVEQELLVPEELKTNEFGRLTKAFSRTWKDKGLQAFFDAAFPGLELVAAARKGSLKTKHGRKEAVLAVASRSFPGVKVSDLDVAQAVQLEADARTFFPGLQRDETWSAIRAIHGGLPQKKPRKKPPRRPPRRVEDGGREVREAIERQYGADWSLHREKRLEVRRRLLGISKTNSRGRGARKALKDLGLEHLLESHASRAAAFLVAGAPQAVHLVDWDRRSRAEWARLREQGDVKAYVRWAYCELLGVERAALEARDGYPTLRGLRVQYSIPYGTLWAAVADTFGKDEPYLVANLSMPRGTNSGEDGKRTQLARLRRVVGQSIGCRLSRGALRDWLRSLEEVQTLKSWLERFRFVQLQREHYRNNQIELFTHVFVREGLKPWDVPSYNLKKAPDEDVKEIVREFWRSQGLSLSASAQKLAAALRVGALQKAGLGGLLHRRPPRGVKLFRQLAEIAAPQKDWGSVEFDDQSEYCRLGYDFERIVRDVFKQSAKGEYSENEPFDPQDGGGHTKPDFTPKSGRLRGVLGDFVDAKLTSGTGELNSGENVSRLAKKHRVTVVFAIRTTTPTTWPLRRISFDDLLLLLEIEGASKQEFQDQFAAVVDRYRELKRGKA